MRWSDSLTLATRSLRRRLAHATLTCLGVALGSGLLVSLGTISSAADTNVIGRLSHGGPISAIKVAAALPQPDQLDSDNLKGGAIHLLDDQALSAIRRLPHVNSVVPVMTSEALAIPPAADVFFGTMVGTDLGHAADLPITLTAGRLPAAGSLTEAAVTGSYLDHVHVGELHAASVLGTQVELAAPRREANSAVRFRGRWTRVTIVGVVAQQVGDGDFLVPLRQTQLARDWAVGGAGDPDFPLLASPYTGLVAVATSLDDVHNVRAEISARGYASSSPEHLVASVKRYLHVVDIVLGGIGSVALAIAALDIASSMLAAVHERRREIGVLKAIGGRDRDVLRWFLLEALILGLVGGAVGSLAGVGIAEVVGLVVNHYLTTQDLGSVNLTVIPTAILLGGLAGATLLAMIAGVVPAMLAARLPAREAVFAE
ncbi:MAG: ABC transporter permease [Candidatus Dormibacteraeota bacterium]|nr:ABC transporter permease [Candidatus Dormibacteraeota bacterium]